MFFIHFLFLIDDGSKESKTFIHIIEQYLSYSSTFEYDYFPCSRDYKTAHTKHLIPQLKYRGNCDSRERYSCSIW